MMHANFVIEEWNQESLPKVKWKVVE